MTEKKGILNKKMLPEGLEGLVKLQPQALDLEEAVLGAILLERDAFMQVATMLKPESFYKDGHQKIYKAISALFNKLEPIDILSVTNQLRTTGELEMSGGAHYIVGLTQKVNAADNIEYHAKVVAEQAIKRELIAMATKLERLAYEDTSDVFDLLNQASKEIYQIERSYFSRETKTIMELSKEVMQDVQAASQKKDGITGEIMGIEGIDNFTKGIGSQDFIVIGARPGMGKSSLGDGFIYPRDE
jgi:replicative DNA helicase